MEKLSSQKQIPLCDALQKHHRTSGSTCPSPHWQMTWHHPRWHVTWPFLAVDFDDFYCQHFSKFHTFKAINLIISFTLTSSTSFGEYLNSGTKCKKLGCFGNIPRPTGLAPRNSGSGFLQHAEKHKCLIRSCAHEGGLIQWPEKIHTWIRNPTCRREIVDYLWHNYYRTKATISGATWRQTQAQLHVEVTSTILPASKTS